MSFFDTERVLNLELEKSKSLPLKLTIIMFFSVENNLTILELNVLIYKLRRLAYIISKGCSTLIGMLICGYIKMDFLPHMNCYLTPDISFKPKIITKYQNQIIPPIRV
jgi:hypothetical protein